MNRTIAIVGGGAAGLAAAIFAAGAGASVTVIEHKDRVGKKLLSTGNGRCNLTNRRMGADCYRCGEPEFPLKVVGAFPAERTIRFFEKLGIEPKDRNGYIYPNSDQASSVLDGLRFEAEHLGVRFLLSREAKGLISDGRGGWRVETDNGSVKAERVILAAGSKAAPSTGSDGSGYRLAESLGHRMIKPLPALVQLRCQGNVYRQVAGVRTEASVRLLANGKELARDFGEVQLTDYGLSGIPVFQVSRFAARALDEGKRVTAVLDFMPSWEDEKAFSLLKRRAKTLAYRPAGELLTGMLNKKLAGALLKLAGINPGELSGELTGRQLGRLLSQIKTYEALVMSVNPFENAQVCCGGIDTRDVNPETMESRVKRGLYFAGEILDVDGICGGYNLQFAWSSAYLAAKAAAGESGKEAGR